MAGVVYSLWLPEVISEALVKGGLDAGRQDGAPSVSHCHVIESRSRVVST